MHLFRTFIVTLLISLAIPFTTYASDTANDITSFLSPIMEMALLTKAERKEMYVNKQDTPIYKSINSEPVSLAPINCTVEVLTIKNGWAVISTCDGIGYVPADNLQDTEVETRQLRSLGNFRITYYCPHACCGTGNGVTASGRKATVGRTVAISKKWAPLGTHLLINGKEYVVDDRGVTGNTVDILVNTHKEAKKRGVDHAEVFVIES